MPINFNHKTTALEAIQGHDLTNRVAVVTGGNSGIGVDTVNALATAGAHVVLCSRSIEAGEKIAETLRSPNVKGKITVKRLDLSDLASVKALADSLNSELPRLDFLILNAGVMACPLQRTAQGFEMQVGVNHLGHFSLTQRLLPKLKASATKDKPARVVAVASEAHRFGAIDLDDLNYEKRKYSSWGSYGQAKLANVLFAKELARRMEEEKSNVLAYSLHPGVIMTNLQRHMPTWQQFLFRPFNFMMKTTEQGAATSIVATTADGLPNGGYLKDCAVGVATKAGQDGDMAMKLWELSEKLIKEKGY